MSKKLILTICKNQPTLICRKEVTLKQWLFMSKIPDFDSKTPKMSPFDLNEFLDKIWTFGTVWFYGQMTVKNGRIFFSFFGCKRIFLPSIFHLCHGQIWSLLFSFSVSPSFLHTVSKSYFGSKIEFWPNIANNPIWIFCAKIQSYSWILDSRMIKC